MSEKLFAVQKIMAVVQGGSKTYHKHYTRVVDKAGLYKKLCTGEGVDSLMERFVKRESLAAFEQRKNLTQHIVSVIADNIQTTFQKVPRSNSLRRVVAYKGEDNEKRVALEKVLSSFWGNMSMDDFFAIRFMELNATDPNAFVVLEFKPFDNRKERAQPYPFVVPSSAAIDFSYTNNVLDYLIAKTSISTNGERISVYLPNYTVTGERIDGKELEVERPADDYVTFEHGGQTYFQAGRYYYLVQFFEHKTGYVPAFRVGYSRDLVTEGETFVNIFDRAIPLFMKTIKSNSELDLTMSLSAFPLSIRYANKCDANECLGGKTGSGGLCGSCEGTGFKKPTSAQEEIVIGLPRNPEEMIDLDKLQTYKHPPVEFVKFMNDYINELSDKCQKAVFKSEITTKTEVAKTAYGQNISLQSVYDVLYNCALNLGRCFEFAAKTVAKITDLDDGLVVSYKFGKDFKMKSMEDLILDLKLATETGSPLLVRAITNDIALIQYSEDQYELGKYLTKEFFNPFSGKTEIEIMGLLSGGLIPLSQRVLYANMGYVFDELEIVAASKNENFYDYARNKQRLLIKSITEELVEKIKSEQEITL
jgi:hypothetical protein